MINLNGTLVKKSEATIAITNRGMQFGDALFETLKISAGKILFWEDHYFRLMASMRILRMEIPQTFTLEFLETEILKTLDLEQATTYRVKLLVWRDAEGKYTPSDNEIGYSISSEILDTPFYTLNEDPYEVELYKDHYVMSSLLSTLKTTNKVINVVGSIWAKENDYQNCLMLNDKKQVIEALNGNLFLVKNGRIKTPPLADGCLKGIIRKQILAILTAVPDYIIEEASISPFELQKADELFVTNVITGIQPITKYRKKEYDNTVAKELLGKLNAKARFQ
ncbi:4-amino-4-deoxychorismate lyase, putative [unidentified eubacterium SCB49]|nr:4-amino-4-deoxychorismate lyase, putative [unidentified eubacterium SCB49]